MIQGFPRNLVIRIQNSSLMTGFLRNILLVFFLFHILHGLTLAEQVLVLGILLEVSFQSLGVKFLQLQFPLLDG